MSISADTFREVLSSWASGVTIVTSRAGERVQGMTVSAFSSVSLDPPLVLVCADQTSITHGIIRDSGVFSVSVLARGQEPLSNLFASKRDEHRRFERLDCAEGRTGCPRIPGALAWLDCRVTQAVEAGDHVVYLAEVVEAVRGDQQPLVYYGGRYASLEPA